VNFGELKLVNYDEMWLTVIKRGEAMVNVVKGGEMW